MAAESQIDDLRVVIESRPTAFTTRWDDRLGSRSEDGTFATAAAAGLGWRQGWGMAGRPWLGLAGVEVIELRETATGIADTGQALRLEAGAGLALSHRLTLTLMPLLGIGRVAMTARPAAAPDLALSGPLHEYGLRIGARWSLNDRWSLGGEAGWLQAEEHLSGDDATLHLASSGAWFTLALAWTIDPLPRTLQ